MARTSFPPASYLPLGEAASEPPPRRRYSDEAFRFLPKLFILIDRNPYSRTYGCFDRAYWHYRTMDFPCGMSQEFALPLALAYQHDYPDNPWRGVERVRQLALAAVDFAAKSAHPDGSCDDYFPYEQALGRRRVFALLAERDVQGPRRARRPRAWNSSRAALIGCWPIRKPDA